MKIGNLIRSLYPDSWFVIRDDQEYSPSLDLTKVDIEFTKNPIQLDHLELEAENKRLEDIKAAEAYKELRRKEYPKIDEQLEVIMDVIGPAFSNDTAVKDLWDRIQAVKAKYPKS